MKRLRYPFFAVCLLALCAGCGNGSEKEAQPVPKEDEPAVVPSLTVWQDELRADGSAALRIEAGGEEDLIAENALDWRVSEDRETVYFSYRHGRSGFEAEGQGLMRYHVASKKTELVFDDDVMIVDFYEELTASGRTALIVEMVDGGLGAPTVAIADPDRGRVFRERVGTVTKVGDWKVTIATYTTQAIADAEGALPEPESTTEYDLDELLDRKADRDILFPWPPDD